LIASGSVIREPWQEFLNRKRLTEQIALRNITAIGPDEVQLLLRLYAFRNHSHAEIVTDFYGLLNHDPIAIILVNVLNK
jgi:hypothetical protein